MYRSGAHIDTARRCPRQDLLYPISPTGQGVDSCSSTLLKSPLARDETVVLELDQRQKQFPGDGRVLGGHVSEKALKVVWSEFSQAVQDALMNGFELDEPRPLSEGQEPAQQF
jgi:hypothetical protein